MKAKDKDKLLKHLTDDQKRVLKFYRLDPRNFKAVEQGARYIRFENIINKEVRDIEY